MQYVNYLNHPLHTVSAKAVARSSIARAISELGDMEWTAPEMTSKPRAQRCCPVATPRPHTRRTPSLKTDDVLQVVCLPVLAKLMKVESQSIGRWGVNVPIQHEIWLCSLLKQWPAVKVLHQRLAEGVACHLIAKELGINTGSAGQICAEFGLDAWTLQS